MIALRLDVSRGKEGDSYATNLEPQVLQASIVMKRWAPVIVLAAWLLVVGAVSAGGGVFSSYSDQTGSCSVTDTRPGSIIAYIVHRSPAFDLGVTGAAFRLGAGDGFSGVLESFSSNFLFIGDLIQGIQLSYSGCLNDTEILIGVATFMAFGTSTPCSYIRVLPFTDNGVVEAYRCDFSMEPAVSTPLVVNHHPGCGPLWCILGVETSTWGSIKAMYR